MRIVLFTTLMLMCNTLLSQETYTDEEKDSIYKVKILKEIDSLNYSEIDFDILKKYFLENHKLNKIITNRASQGNKDAIDFIEILNLSYDDAIHKYGKSEINTMIYSYYGSKKTLDKFKDLESSFDAKIDSLEKHKAYFKKSIDSLKKE